MQTKNERSCHEPRDAFFDALYNLALGDRGLVFLTADMGAMSLERFKRDLPAQYINVGVAEQNMINIAAGMSLAGKRVFIYSIAAFVTLRCYEQIKVNLSGMSLPVTIIGVGPGVDYGSDGYTHHTPGDISIMRALPEMIILAASDSVMAAAAAGLAYRSKSPVYVRLCKGRFPLLYAEGASFGEGMSLLRKGRDLLIISTGTMTHQALFVSRQLLPYSIDAGVVDLYRIKPVNEMLLLSIVKDYEKILVLEEHSVLGGIGSAVIEILSDQGRHIPVKRLGIADKYCPRYGDKEWLCSFYGLDAESICKEILNWKIT